MFFLTEDDVLTGVLADGTPFLFSALDNDEVERSWTTLTLTDSVTIGPAIIDAARDFVRFGIRTGQTLVVGPNSSIVSNFNSGRGSTVSVGPGGIVGKNLEAVEATVVVQYGELGDGFGAFNDSHVQIEHGIVGMGMNIHGSSLSITDSTVGEQISISAGSDIVATRTNFGDKVSL